MEDVLSIQTLAATAAVMLAATSDPMDVVDVLLETYGFDRTFQALSALDTPRAHQAMWAALCCLVFDEAVD